MIFLRIAAKRCKFDASAVGLMALVLLLCATARAAVSLRAGASSLNFPRGKSKQFGVRLQLDANAATFERAQPLQLELTGADEKSVWLQAAYSQIQRRGADVVASGLISSAAGTRFVFTDVYRAQGGGFSVARDVKIENPQPADHAFDTRYELLSSAPLAMENCDYFVPGVWYRHNETVPAKAIASKLGDRDYFVREDRLPLPLAMLRERASGATLMLLHLGGNPVSFVGENGLARLADARMQFGSVGVMRRGPDQNSVLGAAFWFPGTEGERTTIGGSSTEGGRYARRSHPVEVGVAHRYQLLLRGSRTPDYAAAVQSSWRAAWNATAPPLIYADLNKVYRDGFALLDAVCRPYNGTVGLPFLLSMPAATVPSPGALSGQMGFVGQQIPASALLLRYGLEKGDAAAVARAETLIDWWADNSATDAGVLRTWYDIQGDGSRTWRPYKMYLRVACDGMSGTLQAWDIAKRNGRDHPNWLRFARDFGDWLVTNQNADGSYFREYDFDGKPLQRTTDTSDHPIRFLVELFRATGDSRYRDAALKAGEFCLRSVDANYAYVGGTPDNPNVTDKEGGVMALDAFLALYDAGGERKWLDAALRAATFCETWTFGWNIPMAPGDPKNTFPANRTTLGLSLIATGHSGADNFMAREVFDFYRLSLFTGDAHYRQFARFLLFDTKQLLDWDGTLGYKYPALQLEAMSLALGRGHSVGTWLPWLTVASIEPLTRLRDVFGDINIDVIERRPLSRRQQENASFGKTRGFALRKPKS